MNTELFPLDCIQMDSPRLAWLKKHRVKTLHTPHCEEAPWCAFFLQEGDTEDNWQLPGDFEVGFDENDAITELAKQNGIKLWNEETP